MSYLNRKYQALACNYEVWSIRDDGISLKHIVSRHVTKEKADSMCAKYMKADNKPYVVRPV
jgi:hypothetical protein